MDSNRSLPDALLDRLARVQSVGAITGAGVSCESGIRAYRGKGGLYDDPVEGERTVEALTATTFARDPDRTWRALGMLAREAHGARPNATHRALVEIEDAVEHFVLLTQNVDGLHQLAGSRNVIDVHGNILVTRCLSCARAGRLDRAMLEGLDAAPRCPECGGTLRPDAVLFGETLPPAKVARMEREFHDRAPDLVIVAGTSALFPYIVAPVISACAEDRLTVEINPEETPLSGVVEHSLRGASGVFIPLIAAALGSAAASCRGAG